ncbi:hypothetical protein [Sedimentibacter sp.]|uniref:hypothetical protein n=1 Tax=Sedimentibacter sp. TaxID=1960295 RepID=UPI0037DA4A5E
MPVPEMPIPSKPTVVLAATTYAHKSYCLQRRLRTEINSLVSKYTVAKFKPHVNKCNESKIANLVNRKFNNQKHLNAVVSDLLFKSK